MRGPLYIYREGTTVVLQLLYVDDISIVYLSNAVAVVKDIKAKLVAKYKVTNLGTARQFSESRSLARLLRIPAGVPIATQLAWGKEH